MATIGTFKLTENGRFEGTLGTLTVRAPLNVVPVSAKTSAAATTTSAWCSTTRASPPRSTPALKPADEPDTHRLVWSRPKRNDK